MSEFYIVIYIILWIVTFFLYQKKTGKFDAGSFILLCYLFFSVASLLLWVNPYYKGEYKELSFFPFVYLYIFTMVASSPILKYNSKRVKLIIPPANGIKNTISVLLILASIARIPYVITHLQEGLLKIMVDSTMGNELYWDALDNASEGGSGVSSIASIVTAALSSIGILLFFYELTLKKPNKVLLIGLVISMIVALLGPIADGFRGGTVLLVFGIVITYFAFKQFYSDKITKWVRKFGLVMLVLISVPIVIMTISRFGEREQGALGSVVEYTGQENLNFNNYGLDAGGIRYGDRTFNLIKRVFWDDVPKNYMERRAKYPSMKMDDNVYYTFIGDFTLDFGPFWAALIIIFFNWGINTIRIKRGAIHFHQMILVFLVMQICSRGAMTLFTFSDTANIALISFFIAYFAFKIAKDIETRNSKRNEEIVL